LRSDPNLPEILIPDSFVLFLPGIFFPRLLLQLIAVKLSSHLFCLLFVPENFCFTSSFRPFIFYPAYFPCTLFRLPGRVIHDLRFAIVAASLMFPSGSRILPNDKASFAWGLVPRALVFTAYLRDCPYSVSGCTATTATPSCGGKDGRPTAVVPWLLFPGSSAGPTVQHGRAAVVARSGETYSLMSEAHEQLVDETDLRKCKKPTTASFVICSGFVPSCCHWSLYWPGVLPSGWGAFSPRLYSHPIRCGFLVRVSMPFRFD